MAMLAEKKRKTKWCLNPMGNDWAKDENKFGQKMLEKMGWSPGSGLGARGQGPTDIIKISVKNDTLGLGSKHENKKEVWTKTLVNYDSLLAQLNGVSNPEEREPETLQSLEEKSRSSRARVHYHKFTRGKDVSKYSSKDLSCILPLHTAKEGEEDSASVHNNMYAYFGKKEKNPYKTLDYDETEIEPQYETTDYQIEFHECDEVKESDKQENEDSIVRKKKKNKKHKNLESEDCLGSIENGDNTHDVPEYNSDEINNLMQENEVNVEIKKKKTKKNKNKHLEKVNTLETVESCENDNTNINDGECNAETEANEEPVKKKSKKNKRKYLEEVNNLDTEEKHIDIQENTDGALKKKKSKKNKSKHLEEIHTSEEVETVNFDNEEKNDVSKLSSTDIIPRKKKKDKFKTG